MEAADTGRPPWGVEVPGRILLSVVTYVGATFELTGFVLERLNLVRTFLAQIAGSFVALVTPAAVGGVALNIRYLQKANVSPSDAGSSVGVSQVIAFSLHMILLVIFAAFTRDAPEGFTPAAGMGLDHAGRAGGGGAQGAKARDGHGFRASGAAPAGGRFALRCPARCLLHEAGSARLAAPDLVRWSLRTRAGRPSGSWALRGPPAPAHTVSQASRLRKLCGLGRPAGTSLGAFWRGARRVCGCAWCPGWAWFAVARFTFLSATLLCASRWPRTGAGVRQRAAGVLCRRSASPPGGVYCWCCSLQALARTRSPSSSRPCSGRPARPARSAGGVRVRCRRGVV
jgi:Lysylphosphatidylglycerol synthase TM region